MNEYYYQVTEEKIKEIGVETIFASKFHKQFQRNLKQIKHDFLWNYGAKLNKFLTAKPSTPVCAC